MPSFDTELEAHGPGVVAVIPEDVMDELGGRRVPVVATVNEYAWRTTTAVYGGVAMIGLNKDVQRAARVGPGDRVHVELVRDEAPREVEVPAALATALANEVAAREAFDSMSFTHRKEYARWIDEAKKEETRARRVAKAIEMLCAGRTIS
jgi:Bacteriocin-protection, YdeI or OmpD-Associated/Domain of unknown function (DUF1905)